MAILKVETDIITNISARPLELTLLFLSVRS